jgi:hypothetical protein
VWIARLASCLAFALAGALAGGRAEACPPAAVLAGDPALVASVGHELVRRGIAIDTEATCAAVRATVAHSPADPAAGDDGALIVTIAAAGGAPVERSVRGVGTAASVFESFARTDVGSPLLAARVLAPPPSPPPDPPRPRASGEDLAAVAPPSVVRARYHVVAGPEVTVASDDSRWLGGQVGGCIALGPVCAGARLRFSRQLHHPDEWMAGTERHTTELLVGLDVPLRVGPLIFVPGFSAGFGVFNTKVASPRLDVESGGLRADAHASLAIPLGNRFALDLSLAVDLSQQTEPFEGLDQVNMVPPEPLVLARFGVGLRYGEPR